MKIEVPDHELSNYRIALAAFTKSKKQTAKQWQRVMNNAKRLAEAIDVRCYKEASHDQR